MKVFVAGLCITLVLFVAACSNKDSDDDSGEDCVFGQVESCSCGDGIKSTRICLSDGKYTECDCGESIGCNEPGERFECECPNGGNGYQFCLKEGIRSRCNCPNSGSCCHDLGSCIAEDIVAGMVSESDLENFGEDTCGSNSGLLCIPDDLADQNVPEYCESVLRSEGRCLPDCLPQVFGSTIPLPQSTCPKHHLCVPCYDALNHTRTGACNMPNDAPIYPPQTFDECCGGTGHCIPVDDIESGITEEQISLLGKDICEGDDRVKCIPEVFLEDADFTPKACQSIANSEGRCLPHCLPSIAGLAVSLPQDECEGNFVCAPCFDPFTGEQTDVCNFPNDDGPVMTPVVFDQCCGGLGHCVPQDVVPVDQVSLLSEDSCKEGQDLLCVPSVFTDTEGYVPVECVSLSRSEGRCLPNCLPEIADASIELPKDVCPDNYSCAPCYDPVTGHKTDACRIMDEEPGPRGPLFDTCCGGKGTCVSGDLLSESQKVCLGEDACDANSNLFCVPNQMVDFENYIPEYCTTIFNADGFCTPKCMPDAQMLDFPQDVCSDDEVCVPYKDPTTGEDNKCGLDFDEDKEWDNQIEFPGCCESRGEDHGTCIPKDLIPEDLIYDVTLNELKRDKCPSGKNYVCLPNSVIEDPNYYEPCEGAIVIPIDDLLTLLDLIGSIAGGGGEGGTAGGAAGGGGAGAGAGGDISLNTYIPDDGVCVAECMLDEADIEQNDLEQKTCAAHELCVPCTGISGLIPGACP